MGFGLITRILLSLRSHLKRVGFVFVLLGISSLLNAQPPDTVWTYRYVSPRSDCVTDVIALENQDIVMTIEGDRESGGIGNLTKLLKLDRDGNEVWVRSYDTLSVGRCNALARTDDGGFLLVGGSYAYLVRTDSEGIPLWTRQETYGLDVNFIWDVATTSDGGFVLLTDSNYLIRLNAVGDTIWTRRHVVDAIEFIQKELAVTPDGGYMYCFSTLSVPGGFHQMGVVKTDSDGNQEWMRMLGSLVNETVRTLAVLGDGGCIMGGSVAPTINNPEYPVFARLSSTGDSLWMHYDSTPGVIGSCRVLDEETMLLIGGSIDEEHRARLRLTAIDPDGLPVWSTSFSLDGYLSGGALCVIDENAFYAAGAIEYLPTIPVDLWAARYELPSATNPDLRLNAVSSVNLSCYPNPFNGVSMIEFELDRTERLNLILFDILGRFVMDIGSGVYGPGTHTILLDASTLTTGKYICRVQGNESFSRAITFVK